MTDKEWQAKFDALQKEHAGHLEGVGKARADEIAALNAAHAEALKAQAEKLAADHAATFRSALEAQAADLAQKHAAHVAKLKQDHLIPAVRDLHARKMADLQKAHEQAKAAEQAQLDELMKG